MIHNRKKNRGSVLLVEFFQPILINSVSNRSCYTVSRSSFEISNRRRRTNRAEDETLHVVRMEAPINWTTRMSRENIFLFTITHPPQRRTFLYATDRVVSRIKGRGTKILVIETTKRRKEKLKENVRETRTKGGGTFETALHSTLLRSHKTYIIRVPLPSPHSRVSNSLNED